MIEQIAWTPERVCGTPQRKRSMRTLRLADGKMASGEAINQHESNFFPAASRLSILHSEEYPTDKTIIPRDKTPASKQLLTLGTEIFHYTILCRSI